MSRVRNLITLVRLQPELTLADAIRQGAPGALPVLSHFDLTEAEAYGYARLTKRIGWRWHLRKTARIMTPDIVIDAASRLVGAAANKLEALRELMARRLRTTHTLFYCGMVCRGGGE